MFTQDGKHLIAGTKGGTLEMYGLESLSLTRCIHGHKSKITGLLELAHESGIFVSASLDSTLRVWNRSYEGSILYGHTVGVTCISSSQDATAIASGSQDGSIRMWNPLLCSCTGILVGHSKAVNCISFAASDTRIISGSDDTTTRVWSIADHNCIMCVHYPDSVKTVCATSHETFVTGAHCSHQQLRLWSTGTGECLKEFAGHTHAVMCMLRVDEHHFLTGSRDGTVRVWNFSVVEPLASFDLQSQVKHISLTKLIPGHFLLAATTKSGPIAFLNFCLIQ